MFDTISKVLAKSDGFCEIRIQDRTTRQINVKNGLLHTSVVRRSLGAGIRVIRNGCWGFASTSTLDTRNLTKALKQAETSAIMLAKQAKKKIPKFDTSKLVSVDSTNRSSVDLNNITVDEKIALALSIEERIRKSSKQIVTSTTLYQEYVDEKWLMTTDGAKCHTFEARPQFYTMAVASKDGELATSMNANGVTGGMNELFEKFTPEQMADKTSKLAVDKLSAPYANNGVFDVVLSPAMVGILAHEAIGHTVEADFVMSGSVAQGKIGKKVASDLVTLADAGNNPTRVGHPAGTIFVDDEGVEVQDTVIIENGVMKSYLHDRQSAHQFGVEPTGNARAWSHTDTPIIRMRNTYIKPGKNSFDEIIDSTKNGYYLTFPGSGQADSNAEFMFGCEEIYEIKDGKVGRLMKNATISGQAFDVLMSVDMVGNDFDWAMG